MTDGAAGPATDGAGAATSGGATAAAVATSGGGLRLHDTYTGAVREFVPIRPGHASIYLCGATVQGLPHILGRATAGHWVKHDENLSSRCRIVIHAPAPPTALHIPNTPHWGGSESLPSETLPRFTKRKICSTRPRRRC